MKAAEQVIADALDRVGFDGADTAKSMFRFLCDAGYVVLPVEPTEEMIVTDEMVERARKEFWRVLAIKELTVEDAWRAALEAALAGPGFQGSSVRSL